MADAVTSRQGDRPAGSRARRTVVVNLDATSAFSTWARRLSPDLYRLREFPKIDRPRIVDLWDVAPDTHRDGPQSDMDEIAVRWRYWPKPLAGVRAAIAELEERLEAELAEHARERYGAAGVDSASLTIFIVASPGDLLPDAAAAAPGRTAELLGSLAAYLRQRADHALRIKTILVVSGVARASWPMLAAQRFLETAGEAAAALDAVLVVDPGRMGAQIKDSERSSAAFVELRLAMELFQDESFSTTFFLRDRVVAKDLGPYAMTFEPPRIEHAGPLHVSTLDSVLRQVQQQSEQPPAAVRPGEASPFVSLVDGVLRGPEGVERITNAAEMGFDVGLFRPSGETSMAGESSYDENRLIGRRLRRLADMLGDDRKPRRWSRAPSHEVHLEQALIAFLTDLQSELEHKLAGQQSALADSEARGMEIRDRILRRIEDMSLSSFGTGEIAKQNGTYADSAVNLTKEGVDRAIGQFWSQFAADGRQPEDVAPDLARLVGRYCALLRVGWPEVSGFVADAGGRQQMGLLKSYARARQVLQGLAGRPRRWRWFTLSATAMLSVPLLWGLFYLTQGKLEEPVPALGLGIWIFLFLLMCALPAFLLAGQDREVNESLRRMDNAARSLLARIESTMRSVARYSGTIQQNFVLERLRERVGALRAEAARADDYMQSVRTSLGLSQYATREGVGGAASIDELVQRVRAQRDMQWLDSALTALPAGPENNITVHVRGGQGLRIRSSWVTTPDLVAKIERHA